MGLNKVGMVVYLIRYVCIISVLFGIDVESMNNYSLKDDDPKPYNFLVAGHIYGDARTKTVLPSASMLANIDSINALDANFMILLGDNYYKAEIIYISNFIHFFLDKIKIPVFNAVGNHELIGSNLYIEYFKDTFFAFKYMKDYFIILNTEGNDNIISDQSMFLDNQTDIINNDMNIGNIFIFTHKLLWSVNSQRYKIVYNHLNNTVGYINQLKLKNKIFDLIESIDNNVYWFAGDIGDKKSLPLFYDCDSTGRIHYIATGIGDTKNDYMLKIGVNPDKKDNINFDVISLTRYPANKLKSYNLRFWKEYFKEDTYSYISTKSQFLFFRIKNLVSHRYYWYGMITIIVLGLILKIIRVKTK
jgi:hypothetical protein